MKLQTFFFLLPLFLALEAQAAKNQSTYQSDVTVDGRNTEWKTPLTFNNKNTGINFDVANDERNLYLILSVTDTTSQRQVMQNGLEVWINKEGKKNNTTGITFPMAPDKSKPGRKSALSDTNVPDGFNQNINELVLNGFLLENGRQPVKDCPVKVAIRRDSSSLIWEAAIPFNTFYKETLDKEDIKQAFQIGFVVKGVTLDEATVMSRMIMGGGPGGGPDGPRMGNMMNMMAAFGDIDKICWQKVQMTLK